MYFNVDKEKKVIDTNSRIKEMPIFHDQVSADSFEFVPGINVLNVEDIVQEHKNAYEEKSNKLLQEAKNEADRIIEEANNRADKICSDAYDEGYQLGMQKGLDEAREELDKGQLELQQRENELQQEFEAIVNDLEPQFAEIVGGLVESITGVLCENNDIMQYLIDRTIKNLPSSESYVLHINREDYSNVYFNKDRKSVV